MSTENASSALGRLKKTHGCISIKFGYARLPVCPSVLPLNPASLREIDGVAMETPPLARPVAWLDLKPNGDGKPPAKSGATLARNLLSLGFCIEVLAQFWSHFQKSGWIYVNAHSRRGQNPPPPPFPTSLNRDKK